MIFPNLPLYDYFAVVGYNPEFGLKQERRDEFGEGNSPNGPRSPLEASYEAKVIVHFPRERQGKPFASEIASLALPCGVRLFTEQNVPREPSFHSFVIVREDGSRLYGCSLVFYEELRSVELRQQIFDAQMYFLRDFASNYASTSSFSSESPTDSPYSKGTLLQQKQHLLKKFTAHSLPRKFSTSSVRRNSSNVNSSDQKNVEDHSSYYSNPKSLLFASKCMVVLTPLPVIYSSENLLHNFWLIFNDKFSVESSLSLDDALFWTLFQIPLPPPGESIRVTHPKFQLLVRIPTPDDFPYFDYPMETIFNFLSIEKFLKLLTNFLLEKQILLVSKHARTLMLFGECLSALVFPFSWQMAYCPILPHSQLKFLEAPVPWLMGLCYEDENLPEDFSQFNICFLDIDTRRLDLPEDIPAFPKSQQIINSINVLLNEFTDKEIELTSSNKDKKQIHDFYLRGLSFNKALRSIFLSHFASLFTSYENYLLNADINTNCDNIKNSRTTGRSRSARILRESSANFDKISFLVDQPESVLPFLSAFLETQMFTSFIDSKILSLQNSAQAGNGISIFDQKIAELKDIGIVENNLISVKNSEVTSLSDAKIHQISPPTSSKIPPQKYNGFLLISDPSLLEQNESTIMDNLSDGVGSSPLSISNKHCSIKTTNELKKPRINKSDNEDKETSSTNTLIIHENDGTTPMNMAHQNWKFVDQLLKETKAKTKRILVAKMGKEAIHLGHGQLHLGISGVEENTLVASFCDLLERIWSHGLKKKQGKSALWSYIIAYHEWEKRINNNNNKESSRRSSSIGFENNNINNNISLSTHEKEQLPSTTPNEILQNINNGESPKALLELIASFRKIAVPSPSMDSLDNSPHSSSTDSLSNITNNWSQSLLRAANVICETLQQKTNNEKIRKKERNNSKGRLPPLPPQQMDQTSIQNWRINTPKLLRRQKSSEFNEQNEESDDLLNKKSSENNSQVKETYRKFIFQSPLKTVNNNQEERKSRSITKIPTPPRSSSCCQSGGKGNLASRFSEDSLSCISSKNNPSTPKRRPRDLSTSGGLTNFQSQKCQYSRNRSLSRSNSPSRLYEKLTRGMLGGSGRGGLERSLSPLPNTMVYDLKNIVRMTEIKTDIGFARAFVRIALERKLLYQYLKKLLSNTQLLQKLYKRYSLLRCDDEREQFLFHLLSLNAVDFSCFTNTFLTIKMRYQVLMVCGLNRFPDSFVYIVLTGSLGYTSQISLPANNTQFTFDHKNLGILSTLRVGHKINSEGSNHRPIKWFLDYVLVRNCVTAQTFYFRCARWFGRGIDDGALERLLVAEAIVLHPVDEDQEDGINSNNNYYSESPLPNAFLSPRKSNKYYDTSDNSSFQLKNQQRPKISLRSPSCERKLFGLTDNLTEMNNGKDEILGGLDTLQSLEHKTGMAVNALMKHFLTIGECGEQQQFIGNNNAKLSLLLCSNDGGLLSCFNEIFSHGLIQKMFQTIYPWDYVEKVFIWFGQFFRNGEAKKLTREQRSLIIYAYKMIEKISGHSVVGKEGKFNLFMLLCLRDHIFSGLIPLIVWTPITTQFYEQRAFIRNTSKLSYLVKLVGSLNEFQFDYEQSLTHGLVF